VKIRRRIRAGIKWTGAVVTVLLLVVWVGSKWYTAGRFSGPVLFAIASGQVGAEWREPAIHLTSGWRVIPLSKDDSYRWWFRFVRSNTTVGKRYILEAPLWPLILLTADRPSSSLSQGTTGQLAMVEIEPYAATPPEVSVHAPPRTAEQSSSP
jgi:hypothetical protein